MTSKEIELSKALERTERVAKPNTVFLHNKSLKTIGWTTGYAKDPKTDQYIEFPLVKINDKTLKAVIISNEERERFACVDMEIII